MTLEEARTQIRRDSAPLERQLEAAAAIAFSKQSELSDLIRCLRLGGLAAEIAATALHARTGRPFSKDQGLLSADADEWTRYLTNQLQAAVS